MRRILFLVTLFLSISFGQAKAETWILVTSSPVGPTYVYVDQDRIIRNETMTIAWIKYVRPDGSSLISQNRYIQKKRTSAGLYGKAYDPKGNLLWEGELNKIDQPVMKNTLAEALFETFYPKEKEPNKLS